MNWTSPWICTEGKLPVLAANQDGTIPTHLERTALTDNHISFDTDTLTYTGKLQIPNVEETIQSNTLIENEDYSYQIISVDNKAEGTSAGINIGTVTVEITGEGNYSGTVTKTYSINKIPATGMNQIKVVGILDKAKNYIFDLKTLLPGIAEGAVPFTNLTYHPSIKSNSDDILDELNYVSGDTLIIPAKAILSVGKTAVIEVEISSDYHETFTAAITVNSIEKEVISISGLSAQNGTYDKTAHSGYTGAAVFSKEPADKTLTVNYAGRAGTVYEKSAEAPVNVGDYTVTLTLEDDDDYTCTWNADFTIEKKTLTWNQDGVVNSKNYDGTNTAEVTTEPTLNGICEGDNVTVNAGTAAFDSVDAGASVSITATGYGITDQTGNYDAPALQPVFADAAIIAKTLTITDVTATTRTYDGTTAVDLSGGELFGVLPADEGSVGFTLGSGEMDDKDVGDGKVVTTNILLTGSEAGNYTLTQPTDVTVSITARPVTITGLSASDKVHDGTTDTVVTGTAVIDGKIDGDDLTVEAGTAAFDSADKGKDKTVTFSGYTLSGDDARNYELSAQPADVTANIKIGLTIIGVAAVTRSYDGTTNVTLTGGTLVGVDDDANVEFNLGTGTIADKNVGTNKTVTTNITLTGDDSDDYILTQPTNVTVTITARGVTITGLSASSKVHDGTTKASITGTAVLNGKIAGDNLTVINGTAAFDNANAGTGKTVIFSGFSLSGTDAGNYTLSAQPASVKANITAKPIVKTNQTITAKNFTKAYGDKAFNLGAKCSVSSTKLTYTSNNKAVCTISSTGKITIKGTGKATITITAPGSEKYNKATKKITIKVSPKKPTLSSVKTPKTKQVAVTWKKDTRATGYEVQISTKSNFKSGNKSKVITSNKNNTITYTFTKLKKGTTYYGHVRAYKTIDGKKVYGAWSAMKKVKCK